MKTLKAHFDGNIWVLDEAADLPVNQPFELSVAIMSETREVPAALDKLAALARSIPPRASGRTDLAAQHDHYLYGTPKRP